MIGKSHTNVGCGLKGCPQGLELVQDHSSGQIGIPKMFYIPTFQYSLEERQEGTFHSCGDLPMV